MTLDFIASEMVRQRNMKNMTLEKHEQWITELRGNIRQTGGKGKYSEA